MTLVKRNFFPSAVWTRRMCEVLVEGRVLGGAGARVGKVPLLVGGLVPGSTLTTTFWTGLVDTGLLSSVLLADRRGGMLPSLTPSFPSSFPPSGAGMTSFSMLQVLCNPTQLKQNIKKTKGKQTALEVFHILSPGKDRILHVHNLESWGYICSIK